MQNTGIKPEPIIPLTKEQQKLVEENIGLIAGYANLHKLDLSNNRLYGFEDLYGALATGLCKAVSTYDPNKGALSSYAYKAMDYEILAIIQKYRTHNPTSVCYINDMTSNPNNTDNTSYEETYGKDRFFYKNNLYTSDKTDITEYQMIIEEEYKRFGKYGEVFRNVIENGMTIAEASKKVGVTKRLARDCFSIRFIPSIRRRIFEDNKQE